MIGVSDPKLAATRAALREALDETDDRSTRFYIREALQHLVVFESRLDGADGGDGERGDDEPVPVLPVGPHGHSATDREGVPLRAAEFRPDDRDRN